MWKLSTPAITSIAKFIGISGGLKELTLPASQDNLWKEVLDFYFKEFMAFFFPTIYQDIDWNKKYEFLDKELEKIR